MSLASDQRRIWTRREIAEFLSITERSVDNLRRRGRLPAKFLGRQVRFDRDDVMALLSTRGPDGRTPAGMPVVDLIATAPSIVGRGFSPLEKQEGIS